MNIYIVIGSDYDDRWIEGCYANIEDAKARQDMLKLEDRRAGGMQMWYSIETWMLDKDNAD